jgi:hypothetical protein
VHRRLSRSVNWYRSALRREFSDPLDGLVELRALEASGTAGGQAHVDQILCDAFLADLEDGFVRGLYARDRTGNCVVLLDNADSPAGQDFLDMLLDAGRPPSRRQPVVVVATRRTRFAGPSGTVGVDTTIRRLEQASYRDLLARADSEPRPLLYCVQLDDLSDADVATVRRQPDAAVLGDILPFAVRLTDGHPWSVRHLLRLIPTDGIQPRDLRTILDAPDPQHPRRAAAEVALDYLLAGMSPDLRYDLTTCAAAADLSSRSRRCALDSAGASPPDDIEMFCESDMWVAAPSGRRACAPELHPFLRRLLLHALAARPDSDENSWPAVHGRLRRYHSKRGDPVGECYHLLATGELEAVVKYLGTELDEGNTRSWLANLNTITAAPRIVSRASASPRDVVRGLAEHGGGRDNRVLPTLVAALWVSRDPLGDPACSLDVLIAAEFDRLAPRAGRHRDELHDEAERYRRRRRDRMR